MIAAATGIENRQGRASAHKNHAKPSYRWTVKSDQQRDIQPRRKHAGSAGEHQRAGAIAGSGFDGVFECDNQLPERERWLADDSA